jgi:hypothetical protein
MWNFHSVQLPKTLSKAFPDEIHVIDYQKFFWPLWDDNGIRKMFVEKSYNFKPNYAVHLWETASKRNFLSVLSPELLASADTGIFCNLRKIYYGVNTTIGADECHFPEKNSHKDGLSMF